MAPKTELSKATRTPLSRERVLGAAIALADERGIEALSMRKLAAELGFEVMSLYNHVANKDDLLDGIVDLIAGEIDEPSSGPDWKTAMRQSAVSAHQVLLRHPWVCDLWSSRMPGPERLSYMESLLRNLREAGFSKGLAHHGFHAVNTHIVGFTLQELNFTLDGEELKEAAAKFLHGLPAEEFPYLTEHVMQHIDGSDHDDEFIFVLDLILDGLEQVRDSI